MTVLSGWMARANIDAQRCGFASTDELVAYTEKTSTGFLAEILALVSDMDNDVDISELVDAGVAAARLGNGTGHDGRRGGAQDLLEWTHNPALAMANPAKLARLAGRVRVLDAPPPATASTSNAGGAAKVVNASGVSLSTTPEMGGKGAPRRRLVKTPPPRTAAATQ